MFSILAQLVEAFVIGELDDAIAFRRDAGLDVLGGKGVSERVAVIALVGDEGFGGRQSWIEDFSTCVVAHLAFGEHQLRRLTSPSTTAWSFEFRPPLVRPIRRGTPPF